MVEGGGGPEFPVVFYDGEREMNIGTTRIYPMLEFKAFQLMLSQRIGISPNQISIYLCDKKNSKFEDRRRVPITGKANFSLIAREKDCFFLVVLKRSRKSRTRKSKVDFVFGSVYYDQASLMHLNNPYPNPSSFPRIQGTFPMMKKAICEECAGKTSTFHHCVNDPVIVGGYRNRFGPVHPPVNFH